MTVQNNYPKLHNASWPGIVGRRPDSEPPISIDTMIELTADAEVDGIKFDGFDLILNDPHMDIDSSDDEIKRMADKSMAKNLEIGSLVASVWSPNGGGSTIDQWDSAVLAKSNFFCLKTSYKGVSGSLRSQGNLASFQLRFGEETRIYEVVSRVRLDPDDPSSIFLYLSRLPEEPAQLYCARVLTTLLCRKEPLAGEEPSDPYTGWIAPIICASIWCYRRPVITLSSDTTLSKRYIRHLNHNIQV
jgi:hypothetical protein